MILPRTRLFLALIALLCVASPTNLHAQQNTDTRVLNVTVTNSKDRIVLGLKPEHFTVTSEKVPLKIVSCDIDKSPISVGIVVDISSSVVPSSQQPSLSFRQRLASGISRFLEHSNPDNDYFLTLFDGRVSFTTDWTGNTVSIAEKLIAAESKTGTALYDALYYGVQHVAKKRHARHVLLVLSDGQDNTSKKTYNELFDALKRSDVTLYALGLLSSSDEGSALGMEAQGVLDDLTAVTGGRALFLQKSAKPEAINVAFENLANELQSQYRLAIETEKTSSPQKWRKLNLKVSYQDDTGRRPEVRVRARKGFYR
ncbi:MAG TPA: VWA domain-containing protein [Pyrinomonadaceae bacterium]|nr:VWA domain-containing protein [Pyrinomonadaceae bacterium]